jgi:hypothetical protein
MNVNDKWLRDKGYFITGNDKNCLHLSNRMKFALKELFDANEKVSKGKIGYGIVTPKQVDDYFAKIDNHQD